jgi:hypothetical protein
LGVKKEGLRVKNWPFNKYYNNKTVVYRGPTLFVCSFSIEFCLQTHQLSYERMEVLVFLMCNVD